MDIISDQNEFIKEWKPGLEVIYINTEGKTIKEIYEYLTLFTDRTTLNEKYVVTNELKHLMVDEGGINMSKWMADMLTKEREEGIEKGIQQGIEKGIQQGIEKGIEKGIERGIQQGIEQGIEQGRQDGINNILNSLVNDGVITREEANRRLMLSK